MRIAVCVEADGRAAALRRLLAGLAAQQFRARPEPEVFIIIVDVSVGGELREVVAGARDGFRWELEYVAARASQEARRRGIELAIGRGAGVGAARWVRRGGAAPDRGGGAAGAAVQRARHARAPGRGGRGVG